MISPFLIALLGSAVVDGPSALIMASYSLSTWKSMEIVANHWAECFGGNLSNLRTPNQENLDKFVWWGYKEKNWKWSTMVSYLSQLANVFKLKGSDDAAFHSFRTKTLLRCSHFRC
jgi:hypothetical protein